MPDRQADVKGNAESSSQRGRRKLEPDARTRTAILSAATEVVREDGVGALSIAGVLARSRLGTRAFYRNFDSKDQLVAALFLEMAHAEVRRLETLMASAPDAVRAVAAWIDGRLDLALTEDVGPELRHMSMEAQSQMFATPELVGPAYREILRPLIEQLRRGRLEGRFIDIEPDNEALSIQGVVWSHVEHRWSTEQRNSDELRERVQRFCLRGLGVDSKMIEAVIGKPLKKKPLKHATS